MDFSDDSAENTAGFQATEYMLAHGFIDKIVQRNDMKHVVLRLLDYCCV